MRLMDLYRRQIELGLILAGTAGFWFGVAACVRWAVSR